MAKNSTVTASVLIIVLSIIILVSTKISCSQLLDYCDEKIFKAALGTEMPHSKDILAHHGSLCVPEQSVKSFNGSILGYVTPWNNHGYDIAKWFSRKFNWISPVWLQTHRQSIRKYIVTGTHDIDHQWIKDVKQNNSVKVIPRIIFDGWSRQDTSALSNSGERSAIISELVKVAKDNFFDGLVLEAWLHLLSLGKKPAVQFVKQLGKKMQSEKLDLILVIPPFRGQDSAFNSDHFSELAESVKAFSLMTYDFSNPQNPGPNSPEPWVRLCVEHIVPDPNDSRRKQILLGLNFYGNDYTPNGGRSIIGHEYLELLKNNKNKLKFDAESGENFFEVKTKSGRHTVFYPTLYSINRKLKLAEELGTGVSIWEIGQGLDYFYRLL